MKKLKKSKYFKLGLTAFIVVALGIGFKYLIYNSTNFASNVNSIIKVFMPLIDGLVIAYLLTPVMDFFEKKCFIKYYVKKGKVITQKDRKRFRVYSIIITLIIVAGLLYGLFGSVIPQLYYSIENLVVRFPVYYDNFVNWTNDLLSKTNIVAEKNVDELFIKYSKHIEEFTQTTVLPSFKSLAANLYTGVFSFLNAMLDLIIGLIVSIYLMAGKEKFIGQAKKIIYSVMDKEKANNLMVDLRFVHKTFGGFLVGKIIDSLIIGILCFIVLSFLKMPYSVLISVIVGVTNIIPFFGPLFGAIPSAFLILLVDPKKCIVFLIFIMILQQIDGNIIGPAILGNSIGVSSFWIIVAITVFGGFFNVIGMIIGVPLFAVIYAFVRRNVNKRLKKKNLTIMTADYTTLDYINDDNELVMLGAKAAKGSRYIELNPNEFGKGEEEDGNKILSAIKKFFITVVEFVKKIFGKKA
jgi:predicted PurR-regulated permease PerM